MTIKKINLKKLYSIIIALCPLLYNYRAFSIGNSNISVGLIIMLCFIPIGIFENIKRRNYIPFPIVLFFLYFIVNCRFNAYYILFSILVITTWMMTKTPLINYLIVYKVIICISILSSICIIIQFIFHFVTGNHIPMNIPSLLCNDYTFLVKTGKQIGSNMYRPSAFFLEPSHNSVYVLVALIALIRDEIELHANHLREIIIITIGVVLSTSGIGFFCVGLLLFYRLFFKEKFTIRKIINIFFVGIICCLCIYFLLRIDFIQQIVNRVLGNYEGYNAITGRTFAYDWLIPDMKKYEKIWGVGYLNRPIFYVTGYILHRYCLGLIGVFLFWFMLFHNITKKTYRGLIITVLYFGLYFTTSNIYSSALIFFGVLIFEEKKNPRFEVHL